MSDEVLTGGRMHLARSRGAVSGIALIVLGAWGGLAPFIGPYFDFAFTPQPGTAWHWTAARGWFEVLPGGVALVGGLLLLVSANRAMTSFGAWIAILAGGWFVVGPQIAPLLTLGTLGSPADGGQREQVAIYLAFFTALGAVIVLFAALAAGRLSVHSVRDARVAARRDAQEREPEQEPAESAEGETAEADPGAASTDRRAHAPVEQPVQAPSTDADDRDSQPEPEVATSEHPDAPYAPDGHTPQDAELPADATPQPGGPGYETPRRYVRPTDQIPVEQIRRDHPTE